MIKIFEEFINERLFVYHITRNRDQEVIKDIFKNGFEIGFGANCGSGVYSYLNIPKKDIDRSNGVIIKAEVLSLNKFFIEDEMIAKIIYKSNWRIIDQLSILMGKDWVNNINKNELDEIMKDTFVSFIPFLNRGRYSRNDTLEYKQSQSVVNNELKGWIRKHIDGNFWVICYDNHNIKPIEIIEST